MIIEADLTPTEQRMLAVLSDEKPHNRFALQKCLRDELNGVSGIKMHLSNLRKKLKQQGYNIRCELLAGESYYRLIRFSPHVVE